MAHRDGRCPEIVFATQYPRSTCVAVDLKLLSVAGLSYDHFGVPLIV